jgi:hypothetical protein
MKHVHGKLRITGLINDIPPGLLDPIDDFIQMGVSAAASARLETLLTSERTGIEPAFRWDPNCDGSDPQAITNPLALYLVLDPEAEDQEPIVFLTSIQEVFARSIRRCQEAGYFDTTLSMVAEGLRQLADDIDADMPTERYSPTAAMPIKRARLTLVPKTPE